MRIIAGTWKGRAIAAPHGRATRPTSDRVREAMFSVIFSEVGDLVGFHVADLYAGSGALGLEALSRGAASALFVESDKKAISILRNNVQSLGVEPDRVRLILRDVRRIDPVKDMRESYSLLFLDPPYRIDWSEVAQVLTDLAAAKVLCREALVVYEHAATACFSWPAGFCVRAEKRYGDTMVSFAVYEG